MSFNYSDLIFSSSSTYSERERERDQRNQALLRKNPDQTSADVYQRLLTATGVFKSLSAKTPLLNTPSHSVGTNGDVTDSSESTEKCRLAMSSLVQSLASKDENQHLKQSQQPGVYQASAGEALASENNSASSPIEQSQVGDQEPSELTNEDSKIPSDIPIQRELPFEKNKSLTTDQSSAAVNTDRRPAMRALDESVNTTPQTATSSNQLQGVDSKQQKHSSTKALDAVGASLSSVMDGKIEASGESLKVVAREPLSELSMRSAVIQGTQPTTEATTTAVQRLIAQLSSFVTQSLVQQQTMHQVRISLPNQLSSTSSSGEVVLQIQGRDLKIDFRGVSDEAKSLMLPKLGELQMRPGLKDFQVQVSWSSSGLATSSTSTAASVDSMQAKSMGHAGTATDQPNDDRKHRAIYVEEESDDD
jgi:hypothetical protein